ncbi:KTSC domain-containing protein [Lysobacter sp. Root96]|uniref:KTSC domain-containing protein n=1 Tax=Lysobacter sp. Root96 TaxID=1736612 RepID=UPI0006F8A069|nr:KTSC domain-containing protein [Lysobacter sp. Root96]KRD71403.1 hypothetical protein ASE45_06225 [Lysobacter sp. Root96]
MPIIPMIEVESSQIHSIGHDPNSNTLAIRFYRGFGSKKQPGATYHYEHFNADDYEAFRNAESKGKHFGAQIKPFASKHPYTRVAD